MLGLRGGALREAPMTSRRFPAPWTVEQIPGDFKVRDPNGQALVYTTCGRC